MKTIGPRSIDPTIRENPPPPSSSNFVDRLRSATDLSWRQYYELHKMSMLDALTEDQLVETASTGNGATSATHALASSRIATELNRDPKIIARIDELAGLGIRVEFNIHEAQSVFKVNWEALTNA